MRRILDPFRWRLSGDIVAAGRQRARARDQAGDLRAINGNLPFGVREVKYADGVIIRIIYHYGQYIADIFAPPDELVTGVPYGPFFMLRKPETAETSATQGYMFLDRALLPANIEPRGWRYRDLVGGESAGLVNWTGHNQRSIGWTLESEDFYQSRFGGSRYFANYGDIGRPGETPQVRGHIWYNGSFVITVNNLMGAAITTVNDGEDGAPETYIYYVFYLDDPGRVRVSRRRFNLETGVTSSSPTFTTILTLGAGSRWAGQFHFNASGTVAKGLCSTDDTDSIQIITWTIDTDTGFASFTQEPALTERSTSSSGTITTSPGGIFPSDNFPNIYLFQLENTHSSTQTSVKDVIIAADWVGDDPVYLRLQYNWTRTASGSGNITYYRRSGYDPYEGDRTPEPLSDLVGLEEIGPVPESATSTATESASYVLSTEGAYTQTLIDENYSFVDERTRSGTYATNEFSAEINYTWSMTRTYTGNNLRGLSAKNFWALDLRTRSFVFRYGYFTPQSTAVSGDQDNTFATLAQAIATAFVYGFSDLASGYLEETTGIGDGGENISATGLTNPATGYSTITGSGVSSGSSSATLNVNRLDNMGNQIGFYDLGNGAGIASMIFEPGVPGSNYVILYSFYDGATHHAGVVSNEAILTRTEAQIRNLMQLGDENESDFTNRMYSVYFAGFNLKPDPTDVSGFKPLPDTPLG